MTGWMNPLELGVVSDRLQGTFPRTISVPKIQGTRRGRQITSRLGRRKTFRRDRVSAGRKGSDARTRMSGATCQRKKGDDGKGARRTLIADR